MTKHQKKINDLTKELVEWGRKNKVTCDDWHVLMGRMSLHIAQYMIQPTYQMIYDAGEAKRKRKK